ncbi:MAG: interleukin-like EMT inducer domain-containing protein, partial [Candidatus Omnitrophica bacterium]|nr:interleukin-like EMT inducer domain-containing protein [Candidatus Omnitrophota bacterium]
EARVYDALTVPMEGFDSYRFRVMVDGNDAGEIEIQPSRNVYNSGYLNLDLEPGSHAVEFIWLNPEQGLSIEIGKVFIKDTAWVERADLDSDGAITAKDKRLFASHRVRGDLTQQIELDGKIYYATVNLDSGKVVLRTSEGARYTNADSRIPGSALAFDGNDDHISLPYQVINGLNDFTITHRVKLDPLANNKSFIFSGALSASENNEFVTAYDKSMNAWSIYLDGLEYRFDNNDIVEDGLWHTIAFTRSGTALSLYVDGYLVNTVTGTANTVTVAENGFVVGQDQDLIGGGFDPTEAFKGQIDDLSIWGSALTAEQIRKVYTGIPASSVEGFAEYCRGWWDLDEASGTILVDKSQNGYNGAIYGPSWREAGYSYPVEEYGKINDTIAIPLEGDPSVMVRYLIGINEDTGKITLVEENKFDLNRDGRFDTEDMKIMTDAMAATIIDKDANDIKAVSTAGAPWQFGGDDTISNAGFLDPSQIVPWNEYVFKVDASGEYQVGLSLRNDTVYSRDNGWTLPWGSEEQKWEIFSDKFTRDLTQGVYTTAEGDISGTMKMDITGTSPSLYYTRYYATDESPDYRQGWADGTNSAVNMDTAKYIEITYRYEGDDDPVTGAISWSGHDKDYEWDAMDDLTGTVAFDATGVKLPAGEFKTVLIDMRNVPGWTGGVMEAFRFDPVTGGAGSGTVEVKSIAFKETPTARPVAYWGDYPGADDGDMDLRVYVDSVYKGLVSVPWNSTAETTEFLSGAIKTQLDAGVHTVKFEWVDDRGYETAMKVERVFMTDLSDTAPDFNGDFIVDQNDYYNMKTNLGVNLVPSTLDLAGRMFEVNKVETSPGSGEYVYELIGFNEDADLSVSDLGSRTVNIAGADYNLYVDDVESSLTLSSKGLLSMPVSAGEIRFKGNEYYYDVIEGGLYRFTHSLNVSTAHAVQHPNWNTEISVGGKTYGVLEASNGKITLIPAERQEIVLSAVSDPVLGAEFRVNNTAIAPQAGDLVYSRNGIQDPDPSSWTTRAGINIVAVNEDTGERQFTSWDCSNAAYVTQMVNYIRNLTENTIVMMSKEGDKIGALDEAAYLAIESVGSYHIRQVTSNDAWSIVGYMGAPEGSVAEQFKQDESSASSSKVVYIQDSAHPKSYNSNTKIIVGGIIYEVGHDAAGLLELNISNVYTAYINPVTGTQEVDLAGKIYDVAVDAFGRPYLASASEIITEGGRGTVMVDGKLYGVSAVIPGDGEALTEEELTMLEVLGTVSGASGTVFTSNG